VKCISHITLCHESGFGILLIKITAGMCRPGGNYSFVLFALCSETNLVVNNVLYLSHQELLVAFKLTVNRAF